MDDDGTHGRREATGWEPDDLGPGFERLRLPLGEDAGGPILATLVRHVPPARAAARAATPHAVLYVHGWCDYFMNTGLAGFFARHGVRFYAIDLHNYGRSLVPGSLRGYVADLADYDADLGAALAVIRREAATPDGPPRIHLMGHSLGGLTSALWAHRHPGELASLILNSPWLELQGSRFLRQIATAILGPFAKSDPLRVFRHPEWPAYWESLSNEAHGEWDINPDWRPRGSFPFRAGWMRAVLAGHAQVNAGLAIDAPVLVLLSRRSLIQPLWTPAAMGADAVIEVDVMARLALSVGRRVTVNRYDGALHDVALSAAPVRRQLFADLADWLRAYGPAVPAGAASTAAP
ncbi:alpha/beta hydrolase [Specibacter cremeus]|uniref:alpha/beta hydrolase n=1 Tax=Specibacter cremeus TaxID=1629051 RepID=UPI000F79A13B|nr:alpha/beta hydrolase [Specibacter cremeus]